MRQSVDNKKTWIRWRFKRKLEDLEFTDNIALLLTRISDMQKKQQINEITETTHLKINAHKTKTLRMNTKIKDIMKVKDG